MQEARPLRIIHCFRSPIGGIFRHVRDLVEQHDAAGHEVGVICDSLTGGAYEQALFEALTPRLKLGLTRLPIRRAVGFGDIGAAHACYRQIKSLRPDVLHGHGAKGGALARIIGSVLRVQGSRVARFYSPHGGSLHYRKRTLAGEAIFALERLLERQTEGIAFVCAHEQRDYVRKVGPPRHTFRLIHNGIAEAEFAPVPPAANAVDFGFIGMLRDLKGPDVFIDAFQRTERRLERPLSAVIVGDGPDRDRYAGMIEKRGLGRRIHLLPAMRVAEAFQLTDIVVVPSRAESFPYIVLEAVAAGKSVIASRVGGIPEALGKESAALVPPDDPDRLSAVMTEALTSPGWKARTMPEHEAFHQRFSAATMAANMLELYRSQMPEEREAPSRPVL
ncbi:glycosyltransferase family 4 protein [Rhizobium paknamense]|uniref:Glycosyltransferase involved in cell wall biosynthesis n=1 Tax=Rhizobium paknamense TaxID=1206817 RepID=A0ABU0I8Q9_9HYPH|nr:glycosyltransferase family 4 protein [Rhizobium paknamense]MDQ0454057.1 glycosyltransferase involved in cell wall biosynthesis [Rhizobium paknamense]